MTQRNKWLLPQPLTEEFKATMVDLQLHPKLLQYFQSQGLNRQAIEQILNDRIDYDTDPFQMKGMKEGVQRIINAIYANETMMIFGDYDADGITSTVLMIKGLTRLCNILNIPFNLVSESNPVVGGHFNLIYKVPTRSDGYGIKAQVVQKTLEQYNVERLNVIITVDNGIKAREEVKILAELGIDVIVTDHHSVDPTALPLDAIAVINPQQNDCTYPFNMLAGVGVAYKFMNALYDVANIDKARKASVMDSLIEYVAIGTVADMMPMSAPENRDFVKRGLARIHAEPSLGLKAYCTSDAHGYYPIDINAMDATTIGFSIAPPINATGRIDDPNVATRLLLTDSMDEAEVLSRKVVDLNTQRKALQQKHAESIISAVEKNVDTHGLPSIIIEFVEGVPPGLSGLIANDIGTKFGRPAIVFSSRVDGNQEDNMDRLWSGSGRSVNGFNLADALRSCDHLLNGHGGHDMAVGVSILDKNREAFVTTITALADASVADMQPAAIQADIEVDVSEIDMSLYEVIRYLEPYGKDFPNIRIVTKNLRVLDAKAWSKSKKHLQMTLCDDKGNQVNANGWFMAHILDSDMTLDRVDVIYSLELDSSGYNRSSPSLRMALIDIQDHATDSKMPPIPFKQRKQSHGVSSPFEVRSIDWSKKRTD